jgi:hypothetical protein
LAQPTLFRPRPPKPYSNVREAEGKRRLKPQGSGISPTKSEREV